MLPTLLGAMTSLESPDVKVSARREQLMRRENLEGAVTVIGRGYAVEKWGYGWKKTYRRTYKTIKK